MSNEIQQPLLQPLQQPLLVPLQAQVQQPLQALLVRVRQALLQQPLQQLQHLVKWLRKLLAQLLLQQQPQLWRPGADRVLRQLPRQPLHHMQVVLQSVASRLQQLQLQPLLQAEELLPPVLLPQPVELIKVENWVLRQLFRQLLQQLSLILNYSRSPIIEEIPRQQPQQQLVQPQGQQ